MDHMYIEKSSAEGVAERWKRQNCRDLNGDAWGSVESKSKYDALVALGSSPSIESVDSIIGNNNWTHVWCSSCRENKNECAVVGEEDFGAPIRICRECAIEVIRVLDAKE